MPEFRKKLIDDGKKLRVRKDCLSESEIITILIWFNLLAEKIIYLDESFFEIFNRENFKKTDVYYIDSTFLEVCKNQRIYRHKTFKGLAARGVSSCGWFYGNLGTLYQLNLLKSGEFIY